MEGPFTSFAPSNEAFLKFDIRPSSYFLLNNNIIFVYQKTFSNCKFKRNLVFDFYLPEQNICIEYDGAQHFKINKHFGGIESLKLQQKKDEIKNEYCKNNNINLIRIKYNENVENELNKKIY